MIKKGGFRAVLKSGEGVKICLNHHLCEITAVDPSTHTSGQLSNHVQLDTIEFRLLSV